jgi:hypothetical protein
LAIEWDQVLIENILLAAIIVGSIYLERWLVEQSRRRKEREAMKKTINIVINDLENKLRLLESNQYKNYIPFFTDM